MQQLFCLFKSDFNDASSHLLEGDKNKKILPRNCLHHLMSFVLCNVKRKILVGNRRVLVLTIYFYKKNRTEKRLLEKN